MAGSGSKPSAGDETKCPEQNGEVAPDGKANSETKSQNKDKKPLQIPAWFLKHSVRARADLDVSNDSLRITEHKTIADVKGPPDGHMSGSEETQSRRDHASVYEIIRDEYSALQDIVACKLLSDGKDRHRSSPSILLRSESYSDADAFRSLVTLTAREHNATLISCDLGDLEDLAFEFESSNAEQEDSPAKPEDKEDDDGDSSDSDDEVSCSSKVVETWFAGAYGKSKKDEKANERSAKAVSAMLNVSLSEQDQAQDQAPVKKEYSDEDCTITILHLQSVEQILELHKGHEIMSAFHKHISKRRSPKHKILLIGSILIEAESESDVFHFPGRRRGRYSFGCPCSECQPSGIGLSESRLRRVLSIDSGSALDIHFGNVDTNDTVKVDHNKISSYTRKLRRAIRQGFTRREKLLQHDLLDTYPVNDLTSDPRIMELLKKATLSDDNVKRTATQLCGRALRNSTFEVDDIVEVLQRVHRQDKKPPKPGETVNDQVEKIRTDCNEHEESLLSCVIDTKDLQTTYDEVIMDEETKETVKQLISLSKTRVEGASHALLQQVRINGALFYGPPGTGKTNLARAIANDSGANMLAIDSSSIQDKYVGETEKLITAAFSLCMKLWPCILFIDEADALFYGRRGDDKSWERSAITTFLQRMDGLSTGDKSPFVIVATNRPSDLDEAFLRRLPHKVLFSLPSEPERAKILRLWLKEEDLQYPVDDVVNELAGKCNGFSGADLRNLCGQAALAWAVDCAKPGDETSDAKLRLTEAHFAKALQRTRPSVSRQAMRVIENFHNEKGEGSRGTALPPGLLDIKTSGYDFDYRDASFRKVE